MNNMKDIVAKINENNLSLQDKAWNAVFDYADKEAKDVSEFCRFLIDIINEVTGANICRDKEGEKSAGYLQDIVELIGNYCEKEKILDFTDYKDYV